MHYTIYLKKYYEKYVIDFPPNFSQVLCQNFLEVDKAKESEQELKGPSDACQLLF